jgi:hypothetical protein
MSHRVRCIVAAPLVLTFGLLASCSRQASPAANTVDWYLAHTADREGAVQHCANDPGTLGNTPDCVNAMAAAQRADIGSLRNLPPLGLTPGREKKRDAGMRPER